jgi:hypothetical protein
MLEAANEPPDRTDESLLADQKAAVLLRRVAAGVDGRAQQAIDLGERRRDPRALVARLLERGADKHRDPDQILTDAVVELGREPLRLLGLLAPEPRFERLLMRAQRGELAIGRAQLKLIDDLARNQRERVALERCQHPRFGVDHCERAEHRAARRREHHAGVEAQVRGP